MIEKEQAHVQAKPWALCLLFATLRTFLRYTRNVVDKGEKLTLVAGKRSAPPGKGEVRAHLEGKGSRLTPQREAVYDYLRRVHHHPTAEDIYLAVKGRLPRVSLTTVYNALELLVRSGLASKFTYGNASTRYDIRTDVHSHVRCLQCERVEDLDMIPGQRWLRQVRTTGFDVTGFRFEAVGRCAACRKGA